MLYLTKFTFPTADAEHSFFMSQQRTCHDTYYPFQVLSDCGLRQLDFEPITILYGGNGSGKSTALNVIAEKARLLRDSRFNQSNFYPDYLALCEMHVQEDIPEHSRIITSDDVFDFMLNIRSLNEGIDRKRETVFQDYLDTKYSQFKFETMEDYDRLKKVNQSRRQTQSQFVRSELMDNVREFSNGETAFRYFTEKISENGLYILDEPENSLSPKRQMELVRFLEDSARFFGCQIVLSTHSPFILAMQGAKIYNLDENPAAVRRWTDLENVRTYYDFFKQHDSEF